MNEDTSIPALRKTLPRIKLPLARRIERMCAATGDRPALRLIRSHIYTLTMAASSRPVNTEVSRRLN